VKVSLIVAVSDNGVIGHLGRTPWKIKGDLKRFKALTMGKMVVGGSKTFASIGKPLMGRGNVVLTQDATTFYARNPTFSNAMYDVTARLHNLNDSPKEVLERARNFSDFEKYDEAFIIGGEEIYKIFLPIVDTMYITVVHTVVEGDTFFLTRPGPRWKNTEAKWYPAEEHDTADYTCHVWRRK
jgi:dihydrofolate reductase